MDRQLLCQKVHQKISVIKTNTCDDNSSFWHFNSRFVLKTTKTQVFVLITEIIVIFEALYLLKLGPNFKP